MGIFAAIVPLFRSLETLAVSQADFGLPSLHPKIPFPGQGLDGQSRRQPGNIGSLGRPKGALFRACSVFIPDFEPEANRPGICPVGCLLERHPKGWRAACMRRGERQEPNGWLYRNDRPYIRTESRPCHPSFQWSDRRRCGHSNQPVPYLLPVRPQSGPASRPKQRLHSIGHRSPTNDRRTIQSTKSRRPRLLAKRSSRPWHRH